MRRRVVMSIAIVLVFAGSAFSQSGMDIFGGYSYQRTGGEGVNGFNASMTGKVAPWVGLTAEFGLHTKGETIVVPNPTPVAVNVDAKLMSYTTEAGVTRCWNKNRPFLSKTLTTPKLPARI